MILLAYTESNRIIKQDDLAPNCSCDIVEVQIFALLPVIWQLSEQLKVRSTVGSEHLCPTAHAGYIHVSVVKAASKLEGESS